MNIGVLTGRLELEDNLTSTLDRSLIKMESAVTKADKLSTNLTRMGTSLSLGLTAPIVAAGAASLSFSAKFETTMTRLVSLAGVSQDELAGVKERLLELAPATGVGPLALADAMTKVSSTMDNTAVALEIVEMAAKGSAAGLGEAVDVAGAITAVVNSYGDANITAARAADILTKAVQLGGAEAKELAPTLANVVPIAAQLGVSFEEVAANIATVTKLGTPAAEAVTQLSSIMTAMLKETKQGAEALANYGMSYDMLRRSIAENGLQATLANLVGVIGDNKTALTDIFGRVEALRNVMSSAGQQAETYADVLDQVKKSSEGTVGSLEAAFESMKGKQSQTWNELIALVQSTAIVMGDSLAPSMHKVVENSKPFLTSISDAVKWFSELPGSVQGTVLAVVGFGAVLGPVTYALGTIIGLLKTFGPLVTSTMIAVNALKGSYVVSAIAAGEFSMAVGFAGLSLKAFLLAAAPVVLTIAGITAAVTVGYQAWKLYSENKERAMAAERQKPVDASNLEIINRAARKYGQEFSNIAQATEWATKNQEKFRAATQITTPVITSAANAGTKLGDATKYTDSQFAKAIASATTARDVSRLLAEQSRLTTEQTAALQTKLGTLKQAQEQAAEAANAHRKELQDLADTFSGRKIAQEIAKTNAAIGDIKNYDAAGLKRIGDAAEELADKGGTLTGVLLEVWIAQRRWRDGMPDVQTGLQGILKYTVDVTQKVQKQNDVLVGMHSILGKVGTGAIVFGQNVLPQLGAELEKERKKTEQWINDLDQLSRAFEQLANIMGDSFGGVLSDIARVISAWSLAEKAALQFANATTKAGKAAAIMSGIGAVVGATGAGSTVSRMAGGALSGASTGAMIGSLFGPAGTGVGAVIGGIAGGVMGLFRGLSDSQKAAKAAREQVAALAAETARLRGEYVSAAGGINTLNERALTAGTTLTNMLNARTPEAYKQAIDELNAALQFQDDAMATLDATVEKYGFTIGELGKTFGQQKLHEQAMVLLQDYEVLSAAGINHNTIIKKMGPSLQEYVKTALNAGLTIPENLRPVLESMVKMGLLTDEDGKKMTDLSKLTFAETLDKKFSTLIDTIKKLTDAIARGLGGALTNLPQPEAPWSDWPAPPGMPEYSHSGWGPDDAQTSTVYASTGAVIPFKPRGTDVVPAMLTPGERVLSVSENIDYERMRSTGTDNARPVNNFYISNEWNMTTDVDEEKLMPLFLKSITDNVAGARTETREALGVGD
jgi:TP901 family phage tail tape measure protein